MSRLRKLEDDQESLKEIASATILEGDKTMKEYGAEIAKQAAEAVFEKMDTNKDGRISKKEAADFGLETMNGSSLMLILTILFTTVLSAGFMLLRNIIDLDIFVLILQITIPNSLITYVAKRVIDKLSGKAGNMKDYIKILEEDNKILDIAMKLKQAHDKEYLK